MNGLLVATAFLTRVPVRAHGSEDDVRRSIRWFPLVGAGIGMATAALALALSRLSSLPPDLQALVIVGFSIWLTGAIHVDGLADTADGFGGGTTAARRLEIMRDPRIGTFGGVALVLAIGAKAAAISALIGRGTALPALIAAPTLSRWTVLALGAWLPYARAGDGLGRAATRAADLRGLVWATAIALAVPAAVLGRDVLLPAVLAGLVASGVGRLARTRLGGVTGDVFGAAVELAEIAVLIGIVGSTAP